jgi:hypothetical protein
VRRAVVDGEPLGYREDLELLRRALDPELEDVAYHTADERLSER